MRMPAPIPIACAASAVACTCAEATAGPVLVRGSLCSAAATACRARPTGGFPVSGAFLAAGCADETGAYRATVSDERRGVLLRLACRVGWTVGSKACTLLEVAMLADCVLGCASCACLDRATVCEIRAAMWLTAGTVLDCGRTAGCLVCGLLERADAEVGVPGVTAEGAAFKGPRAGGLNAPVPLKTDLMTTCACDAGRVGGKVPTACEAGFTTECGGSCLLAGGMRGDSGRDTARGSRGVEGVTLVSVGGRLVTTGEVMAQPLTALPPTALDLNGRRKPSG